MPENQIQEILSIINEQNRWDDFKTEVLPEVFKTLTKKFTSVSERMVKVKHDSDRF